jgi:transposase-like protein
LGLVGGEPWTAEQKTRIVAESYESGEPMSARHWKLSETMGPVDQDRETPIW